MIVAGSLALDAAGRAAVTGNDHIPATSPPPRAPLTGASTAAGRCLRDAAQRRRQRPRLRHLPRRESAQTIATALAVDTAGRATVTGCTISNNFPTTPGAFDRSFNGVRRRLRGRLNAAGSALDYGT